MKKITSVCIAVILCMMLPASVFAMKGENGYDGGIGSRQTAYKSQKKVVYDYQEVCFITGEPIVFSGTMTLDSSVKSGQITSKYDYKLENKEKSATLTRRLELLTMLTQKENGQTIESTAFTKEPSETIDIGGNTYTVEKFEFLRSAVTDAQPAIHYFAGDTWTKKVYRMDDGSGAVTVEATGNFYGYEQYWSSTEAQVIQYVITCEKTTGSRVDHWGGTASVSLSSTMAKKLKYVKNQPSEISFPGGYVQIESGSSILQYVSKLPEFDSDGVSTKHMITTRSGLKSEPFPKQTRLPADDIRSLRGHWAEDDIQVLFSLEILKGNPAAFYPESVMTRAEFAQAVVLAAREPSDSAVTAKSSRTSAGSRTRASRVKVVSPFKDVPTDSIYFAAIDSAFKRGLMTGAGNDFFQPDGNITVADAVSIFIRALGLESLSPGPHAVTNFTDNDDIPAFAREAVYVADRIGLVRGDERGYLHPNSAVTKAMAAAMLRRFLEYMGNGIEMDYKNRIVEYN